MTNRSGWLERLLRLACAAYPRDFRSLLAADMASVCVREHERIVATNGRAAALRYAVATLLKTAIGVVPARLQGVAPPRIQMDNLLQDIRFGARNLIKNLGFTAVAIASLALGIGANGAIFSVVNAVLLRPLPFLEPDRLVVLWEGNPTLGVERMGPSGPTFLDLRERTTSFEDVALFQHGTGTITGMQEPQQLPAMRVTVNFFDILGFQPRLGRDFLASEASGGRQNVAILSHGFWQRSYGADENVLGRQIMADHIPYTVVGVLPESFWYPLRTDLFVPWDENELLSMRRADREHGVIARLRPGADLAQAQADVNRLSAELEAEHEEMHGYGVQVSPVREETTAFIRPALLVLLGAVGFVLLIACANVANLLLARASVRHREMAIRAATGASRGRLVRQLLTESTLLAAGGGVLGLLLAQVGVRGLASLIPAEVPLPGSSASIMLPAIGINAPVVMFTVAASMATGLLFGVLPAWQTSLIDLTSSLKGDGANSSASRRSGRARNALVAAEMALSVVLLVGAFLMVQTFWNLGGVDAGFEPESVLTMQIEVPTDTRYASDDEQSLFYRQVVGELERLPGVTSVGISEILPLDNDTRHVTFRHESGDASSPGDEIGTEYNIASAGFFEALQIPLRSGRMFEDTDDREHPVVGLVDTTFAAAHFPGEDPVGQQVVLWRQEVEIIGVVGAVRNRGLDERPQPTIYMHYIQEPDNWMSFVLRTRGNQEGLARAAKEAVWRIDPDQPVFNVRRMDAVVAGGTWSSKMTLMLLGLFGAVAVLMAALGVYAVMSHAVGQRTRELGLRQALGADAHRLLVMVVHESLRIAVVGIGIGLVAALGIMRVLSSLLYGVSAGQPLTLALVGLMLLLVAVVATLLPARRAATIDPMAALRDG